MVAIPVALLLLIDNMEEVEEPEDKAKTLVGIPAKQLEVKPLQVVPQQANKHHLVLPQLAKAAGVVERHLLLKPQLVLPHQLAKATGMVDQKAQANQKLVNALKIAGLQERKKDKNDAHAERLKANTLLGATIKLNI